MKTSISWLKDYIDIKETPEKLAEKLIMAGIHVSSIKKENNDALFEFEITSNRSDCLSILGIAREIGALLKRDLYVPDDLLKDTLKVNKKYSRNKSPEIKIEIKDKDLCPRYSGRVIRNVKVTESPDWLKKRLLSIGLRAVNNIVDITNFMLMETGQPMHAFDLDKIRGKVIIRRARKGEAIKIIDGSVKTLEDGMLVIADDERPIAIAGVMGGIDTEVTGQTKNILLESASFDPISIRLTARKLGISTDSSYRFERKVDMDMIVAASNRASAMMRDLAQGTIMGLIDVQSKKPTAIKIKLNPSKTSSVLGVDIKAKDQKSILESLNFKVKRLKNAFLVTAPSSRKDISQEVDLIEEIARIYGYSNIPETIPPIVGNTVLETHENVIKGQARKILSLLGLNEIITYTMANKGLLEKFNLNSENTAVIRNPLSQDHAVMTGTLLIGMMKALAWNLNRKNENLGLFEISKAYQKISEGKYREENRISIGISGAVEKNWLTSGRKKNLYDIKGMVESLFEKLGVGNITFITTSDPNMETGADIIFSGEKAGIIGKPNKELAKKFDIKEDVFIGEIYLSEIQDKIILEKPFTPLPKFPAILRDISIVLDKTVLSKDVVSAIKNSGADNIHNISLIGTYQGEQIPKDKISLLYRLEYRNDSRTLTEEEAERENDKVKQRLISELKASFR